MNGFKLDRGNGSGNGGVLKRVVSAGTFAGGMNVRRDELEPDVWRPAGLPAAVRDDSWRPLQRVALPEAGLDVVFMMTGQLLGAVVARQGAADGDADPLSVLKGDVHEIGQVTGVPLRFDVIEPGVVRVLMRHAPASYVTYSLDMDGSRIGVAFRWNGVMPELPAMALTVADEFSISEPVGAIGLSGSGVVRNTLYGGDLEAVTSNVLGAYSRLKRRALEAGYFIQPTIARYRLLDANGDTIAVSAPVAVCGATGFQCCGEVAFSSTDGLASLDAGTLSARAYRLRLTAPGEMPVPWNRIVRRVVVETLPQVDPVDALGRCTAVVGSTGSSSYSVRVRLPGVSATADVNAARQRALMVSALGGSEGCFGVQSGVDFPFGTGNAPHVIGLHEVGTQDGEVADFPPLRDHVSYGACSGVGELLVLASRRRESFNGYAPLNFAVACEEDAGASWQGVVSVTLARGDGSREVAVATGQGTGCVVTGLSPVLVFPDASATEMTVTIVAVRDGQRQILTETYGLTPLPDAGMACFVAADVRPMMPRGSVGSVLIPEPSVSGRCDAGLVVVCSPLRLAVALSSGRCGDGDVVAVAEAPRSRATWDFSRHKVLLFGSAGTHVVTIGQDAGLRSMAMLDNRPVACRGAVSRRMGVNGLELLVVAGGDLVSVGQSSVKTLVSHCRGAVSGWCGTHREVWLAGGGSPLRRLCSRGNGFEEVEVGLTVADGDVSFVEYGGRLLLSVPGGLLDASSEVVPEEGVPVVLRMRHDLRRLLAAGGSLRLSPAAMPSVVSLWLTASAVSGELTVAADRGSRVAEKLVGLTVDGALNAPVAVGLVAPLREWLETCVEARVSGDAEWHPVELFF